ncbi:MAG TPA: (Fe-S)-binding protein [Acidimicrobiia bacterium]|jgi:L-lactate dehydrogenase complex protein LldE|nr:(Fe-S)-binding protein [Acidimicrobiia bacterium]
MEGRQVQLFVTCLVDSLAPEVGRATVTALEKAGCTVEFPTEQGCCGQPAFNVGLNDDARRMAAQTLDVLDETKGPVVIPSGSCTAMIVHHYPALFHGSDRAEQAERVAARVRELTQYLVDDLDSDMRASCDGCTVAYHYSCHGLRQLGLQDQADRLLEDTDRAEVADDKECCGFGGLFAVEMPAVSTAIMDVKLDRIEESGADTLAGGDISCLLHLEGGLRRRGSDITVRHIAELLAEGPQ